LWKPQNIYYEMIGATYPEMQRSAGQGNEEARAWVQKFPALGEKLGFGAAAKPQ
jgi:hypothetical protein